MLKPIELPNPKNTTITAQVVKQKREEIAAKEAREKALTKIEKILLKLDCFINEAMLNLIKYSNDTLEVETSYPLDHSKDLSTVKKGKDLFNGNIEAFEYFANRMGQKYGLKNVKIFFDCKAGHEIDDMCPSGDGYYYNPSIKFTAELDI